MKKKRPKIYEVHRTKSKYVGPYQKRSQWAWRVWGPNGRLMLKSHPFGAKGAALAACQSLMADLKPGRGILKVEDSE